MNHTHKGMSMALTLVISIVVLIVVSLAVIAITTGNLSNTGKNTQETQDSTFSEIQIKTKCASTGASSVTIDGTTYPCNSYAGSESTGSGSGPGDDTAF